MEHDKADEQRREKTCDEQDRRQRESFRSSNIGVAASKRGRDIYDIELERPYGKRQQIIQDEPKSAVAAPCTPPERVGDAVSKAWLLDDLDDLFGEEGTQAASSAWGDTQLLEDELHKAVDEQFKLANSFFGNSEDEPFGEEATEAACSASGDTQLLDDELHKAVDELLHWMSSFFCISED